MKLIKLTLENIGPYKGKHIIDFNELNSSLFLITGPTGSGKSYIFDSICYALYGETSGGNRKTNNLKSKYATPDDVASVELEFEYQHKEYKIKKEPKQIKRMRRKSSITGADCKEYNEVAVLTMPDGTIIEKNVSDKIKGIIGLDYNQFKMTMMIAQGDFYSLINAGTKEREEIFRKILNTEKLNRFIDKLKDLLGIKSNEVSKINDSIESILRKFVFDDETYSILVNPNELLITKMDVIKAKLDSLEDSLNKEKLDLDNLKNKMLEDTEKLAKAQSDNDNFETYTKEKEKNQSILSDKPVMDEKEGKYKFALEAKEILSVNKEYERIRDYNNKLSEEILELNKTIDKLNVERNELLPTLNKRKELMEENEGMTISIRELSSNINEIQEYNELKSKRFTITAKIEKLEERKKEITKAKENIQDEISKLSLVANLEVKDVEITKLQNDINRIDDEKRALVDKKGYIASYLRDTKEYRNLSKEYDNKLEECQRAKENYNRYEKAFLDSIAGIIAKDLKDGDPCPVCGNIHHVKKAILTEELSENRKNELKHAAEALEAEFAKIKIECEKKITTIKSNVNYIKEFINCDFDDTNVESIFNSLIDAKDNEKQPLIEKKEMLVEENKKINQAKAEVSKLNNQLEAKKQDEERVNVEIHTESNSLSGVQSLIDSKSKYEGMDKVSIEKQISDCEKKIKENTAIIDQIDREEKRINVSLATNKGLLEKTNNQLQESNEELIEAKEKLSNSLKESKFGNLDEAEYYSLPTDEMDKLESEINEYKYKLQYSNDRLAECINKQYDKLVYQDLSELENTKDASSKAYDEANTNYTVNNNIYDTNKKSYDELLRLKEDNSNKLLEFKDVESLYNVAAGKVSGNKVNFEVYYQLQIFEEILKVASFKFNKMTDGRYEMLRGIPSGGNAQIGLEIDVRDLYNGEVRPVSSLSGGESFQASMSLALAFSEIIQIKAGGVELNSMFIDEGFGTLDNEMLDNTKKTLLDIGESTNRKIGIISHIAELEKSIPTKIVVEKSNTGSKFTIVNE